MKAYLVRLEETRELVGLFFALSFDDLLDMVNECCAPSDCEYAVLDRSVGLLDPHSGAPVIPAGIDLDDEDEDDMDELTGLDAIPGRLTLTASLHESLQDELLDWDALDPMLAHHGSQIDALLSSPQGRRYYHERMLDLAEQISNAL